MPKSARSRMLAALGLCILLWAAAVLTDCARCRALREPLFVVPGVTADDGGSGTYWGLGYTVELEKAIDGAGGLRILSAELRLLGRVVAAAAA